MTQRTRSTVERSPVIGDAFGHYHVHGVVGSCGFGRLYVTEQHQLRGVSQTVALLCVRADLAGTPYFSTLFSEAASIAPRLDHPNLVAIHELGELDGTYFVSMESLPAENLSTLLTRWNTGAPMPIDIAVHVVKQAANAVHYLHQRLGAAALPQGLGHVELDPSNLFVTYHGTVKLLGLGLRPIHVSSEASASGEHRVPASSTTGSLAAPEESTGVVDRRTDVFCLGALLWACLTGERPEPAPPEASASAPSRLRGDIPQPLDAIVTQALSPDPRDRFQTVQELGEALERFLARRDFHGTPRQIRRWLEQAFGAERAALQLELARAPCASAAGTGASLQPQSPRPRALWSTNRRASQHWRRSSAPPRSSHGLAGPGSYEDLPVSAVIARPSMSPLLAPEPPRPALLDASTNRRGPRAWLIAALLAVGVLIATGAAVIFSSPVARSQAESRAISSAASERGGRVEVKSVPEGALVFVDGEPTGLRTPALIKGLAVGRTLRLRVEKPGFASQEAAVELSAGAPVTRAFVLVASDGFVRFAGAPAGARIYVDDVALDGEVGALVRLSAGRHAVRVEAQEALLFSGAVNVVPGEQTIDLAGAAAPGPGASE